MTNKIIETIEKIKIDDPYVEAGDLTNEIGKIYMKRLNASIRRNASKKLDKLYFVVSTKKDPTDMNKIHIFIYNLLEPLKKKYESMDLWEYDYKKEKLTPLWSLPDRSMMKNFLRSPEKYNKDLVRWIKEFVAQENIDLNDPTAKVLTK